jgi:hypothetical protein
MKSPLPLIGALALGLAAIGAAPAPAQSPGEHSGQPSDQPSGQQKDQRSDKPAAAPKGQRDCFHIRFVDGFAAPDDKNLYIRVGVRDVYHFDMFAPCLDMDWNERLVLQARPGPWICDGMDAEVVSRATGLGPQRCFVSHMHKLTPQEVAALPRRARP